MLSCRRQRRGEVIRHEVPLPPRCTLSPKDPLTHRLDETSSSPGPRSLPSTEASYCELVTGVYCCWSSRLSMICRRFTRKLSRSHLVVTLGGDGRELAEAGQCVAGAREVAAERIGSGINGRDDGACSIKP